MGRPSGFTAALVPRGFTPTPQRELHLHGLLVHGLATSHGRFALLSVRPFVRRSWVQAHHALHRPTMASADFSLRCDSVAFRRKARSPQVRHVAFSAQPPDLHRLSLGRRSFAALGSLAPLGSASYPVPVRRLADSLAPSFSPPLTVGALGFTWIVTTYSPGDSHPQVSCHAGHTKKRARPSWPGPLGLASGVTGVETNPCSASHRAMA